MDVSHSPSPPLSVNNEVSTTHNKERRNAIDFSFFNPISTTSRDSAFASRSGAISNFSQMRASANCFSTIICSEDEDSSDESVSIPEEAHSASPIPKQNSGMRVDDIKITGLEKLFSKTGVRTVRFSEKQLAPKNAAPEKRKRREATPTSSHTNNNDSSDDKRTIKRKQPSF